MASAYWGEFRTHWRPLLAATIGLGFGIGFNAYIAGLFAPKLIGEFGWSKSEFALLGSFGLLMLIMQPITGRLTDRFGVRTISAIGVIGGPLAYIGYSFMDGNIQTFFAITILQIIIGTLTTSPVYTRLIAERFVNARGLAFSVVMTGPPLAGAVVAPLLGNYIDTEGWRSGYLLVGIIALVFGLLAVFLTPAHNPPKKTEVTERQTAKSDYSLILNNPAFWILIIGMVLVNMPQGLLSSQLKLVLMDSGATSNAATWLISIFAMGVIAGRFVCGVLLDRMEAHKIAAVALGLPALGMALMASPLDATIVLGLAVALMGLAQGAEGDVAAYLVSRRFGLRVFSLVLGLVGASIAGGAALGSLLLSLSLRQWDSYAPFLILSAVVTLIGASLFLLLGRNPERLEGTNI